MMTFRKDWIEELACPRWCRAVESSLGIRKQESRLDEQERNKNMDIFGRKRIAELEDELEKISHREYNTGFYFNSEPGQVYSNGGYMK